MNLRTKCLLLVIPVLLVSAMILPGTSTAYANTYYSGEDNVFSPYTSTAPEIDGIIGDDEWENASAIRFFYEPMSEHPSDYIFILFFNDRDNLYIAFDILCDNTSEEDDFVGMYWNFNQTPSDPDLEIWFMRYRQDSVIYDNYHGDYLYFVDGDGNSLVPWLDFAWGFGTSPNHENRWHTILEVRVSIDIDAEFDEEKWFNCTGLDPYITRASNCYSTLPTNENFSLSLTGYGTMAPAWWYPASYDYMNVTLSHPPEDEPEPEEPSGDGNEFSSGEMLTAAGIGIAGLIAGILIAPAIRPKKR